MSVQIQVADAGAPVPRPSSDVPPTPAVAEPRPIVEPSPVNGFVLQGRISFRQQEKAYHGSLSWVHDAERDEILISGPFGQSMAELRGGPAGASLKLSDGTFLRESNLEALASRLFGADVPVSALPRWMQGIAPEAKRDALGRTLSMVSGGWQIEWLAYEGDTASARPSLISVSSSEISLRIKIDQWEGLPVADVLPTAPSGSSSAAALPDGADVLVQPVKVQP